MRTLGINVLFTNVPQDSMELGLTRMRRFQR